MGSHLPGQKDIRLLRRGYVRVDDVDVENGREKTFVGEAGTIILGDTKCWHKGNMVEKDTRAIFQLEYSCHPISMNR